MPEHQLVFFSNRRQSVTLQDNTNGLSIFSRLMHQPTTAAQGCQFLTREPAREITRLTASAVSDSKRSVAKKKKHTHTFRCLLRGRRGTMCTAKGSDVRPGVPLASLGLRLFCVAGVGQCALPRGWMYALASPWRPWVSASFAWQAWDNARCQGVGCTPWRPSGVPGSPPLLRGRRGTICIAKGSDVRPGVPLASLGLRLFCVAGVGQCALPRGWMYALASPWRPWVSASFAWQAWDNVHCQGVGCTPWRPSGVPGSLPLLRGRRGTMCIAGGRRGTLCSHSLTLSLTHSLIHSFTHSLIHSLTHSLTHSHSLPHSHSLIHSLTHTHSLTPSLPHSLTASLPHSLTPSLTHSFTHSVTHSLTLTHSLTPSLPHSLTLTPSLSLPHSHSLTHSHSLALSLTRSLTHSQ